MKLKFICLLAAFIGIHGAASPNRNCRDVCPAKHSIPAIAGPAVLSETNTDDEDLLPNHYLLNRI